MTTERDFAISKRTDKGWWVMACGTCGEEKTCYNFASACAFLFKHLRCSDREEGEDA